MVNDKLPMTLPEGDVRVNLNHLIRPNRRGTNKRNHITMSLVLSSRQISQYLMKILYDLIFEPIGTLARFHQTSPVMVYI